MNFKEFQQNARRTCPDLLKVYQDKDAQGNLVSLSQLNYIGKDKDGNKTISYSPEILNLLHTRIGIMTETEELMEAIAKKDKVGVGEELADKLWYIGNDLHYCLVAGYIDQGDFNQFVSIEFYTTFMATDAPNMSNNTLNEWMNAIVYNEGKLLDQVKKLYAYNKPFDKCTYLSRMGYLVGAINNIAATCKVDLNEYMEKVINKLRARYPNSFESDAAINRDHTAERVILEK